MGNYGISNTFGGSNLVPGGRWRRRPVPVRSIRSKIGTIPPVMIACCPGRRSLDLSDKEGIVYHVRRKVKWAEECHDGVAAQCKSERIGSKYGVVDTIHAIKEYRLS